MRFVAYVERDSVGDYRAVLRARDRRRRSKVERENEKIIGGVRLPIRASHDISTGRSPVRSGGRPAFARASADVAAELREVESERHRRSV